MSKLLSLVLGAALCLPVFAADTTLLQVKVTNLDGKPVDRASVVVKFVKGRNYAKLGKKSMTHWETRTNQEGLVKLPSIPQGTITVMVIAKGYQTHGKNYELDGDEQTLEIKLNPPQPQYSSHQ